MRWFRRLFARETARIPCAGAPSEGYARIVELELPRSGAREVVLCRVDGRLRALDRDCPHEHGRLAAGPLLRGRYAQCPLHGYAFDPASGRAVDVVCPRARVYRVRERGAWAEISL